MQALIVLCRSSLESSVRACLDGAKVGFTMIDPVSGRGTTGDAPSQWVPSNVMFLVVLPEEEATQLTGRLTELNQELRQNHGGTVPLKVFGVGCEALVG